MKSNKNRKTSWRGKKSIANQNDKIEACERLAKDYKVSKVELLLQYEKFKREHRNGEISKENFLLEEKEWKYSLPLLRNIDKVRPRQRGNSNQDLSWSD